MKDIVKVLLRLFALYVMFKFFIDLSYLIKAILDTVIPDAQYIIYSNVSEMGKFINIITHILYGLAQIILSTFVWIKSETISKKIVRGNNEESLPITLNYHELASVGIIILGLFIITTAIRIALSSTLNNLTFHYMESTELSVNGLWLPMFLVDRLGNIIEMVIGIMIIKYRNKILAFINVK